MKYRDPRIVAIGGGTGMNALLRGAKRVSDDVTAIVTVADDGGNSGWLRDELGVLPPGDFRNCMTALSDSEPQMRQLLQYRFRDGALKGQCFGNLLLVAMEDLAGGFVEGLRATQEVLRVRGRVLPVSMDHLTLCAVTKSGRTIRGEHLVGLSQMEKHDDRIERVYLEPADCSAYPEALEAIDDADLVILGPGSLYTSILPDLLVPGIADAVRNTRAHRIFMGNLMTQPGETEGYRLEQFLDAVRDHCGDGLIDTVVVNRNWDIPEDMLERYREEHAEPVWYDLNKLEEDYRVIETDLLEVANGITRHDRYAVADVLRRLWETL